MSVRKKSRLERLLSFNQHRKRFGAGKASDALLGNEFSALKAQRIEGTTPDYTHGAEKNVEQHLLNLREEFAGQPELLYVHASLIVLIRREYKVDEHFRQFEKLWETEKDWLCSQLNTRWLVSAADTFADYSDNPTERALALGASLLANTVKMQETERYLQSTEAMPDDNERLAELTSKRVDLFDGTSAFAVGTDDTLRNMRWRIDSISALHSTGSLVAEIFKRLQNQDTVYQRFRQRHTREKTRWW